MPDINDETLIRTKKRGAVRACDRCGTAHRPTEMHVWQPPADLEWMTRRNEYALCADCVRDPLGQLDKDAVTYVPTGNEP